MRAIPSIRLMSGFKIPQLGFGLFEASPEKVANAVEVALGTGFRHIDTAPMYNNEKETGEGINRAMKKYGIKREELFISAKLSCDKHALNDVRKACEESLSKLGLDYVDLYLIHWPVAIENKSSLPLDLSDPNSVDYVDIKFEDTWKAMEELVPAGLVKSIGVSNFNKSQIERILKMCRIPPAVNQVEVNLHWPNTELVDYCHSKNIQIEGFAPLRSPGFLKKMGSTEMPLLEEPVVIEIAKKYNRTPAQILLRHGLQSGVVVLSKSVTPERIKSNFKIMDFEISEADMDKLNKISSNTRSIHVPAFMKHPEYPFRE